MRGPAPSSHVTEVRQKSSKFQIWEAGRYHDDDEHHRSSIRQAANQLKLDAAPGSRDPLQPADGHVCAYVSAVGEVGTAAPAFRPECLGAHFQMLMRLIGRKRAEWK